MKTLILYGSKYGATREAVNRLAEALAGETTMQDLAMGTPALDGYEAVIVGGSIYAGMLRKEVKRFCAEHEGDLATKRVGLFLCCTTPAQQEEYFAQNFPAGLLEKAVARENLGGELQIEKLKGLDKMIMNMVKKSREKEGEIVSCRDEEAIKRLAAAIQE